jgi:hypothetical protein
MSRSELILSLNAENPENRREGFMHFQVEFLHSAVLFFSLKTLRLLATFKSSSASKF